VRQLAAEAVGEELREPALHGERRRLLPGEQRGEVQPAEREHRRRLGRAHRRRVPGAVERPDQADDLPAAREPDLGLPPSGDAHCRRDGAVDDEHHLARVVALAPEDLARRDGPPSQHARELRQHRLAQVGEERHGGEEAGDLAVRHRGPASRTRARRPCAPR
jgi:hypothetical protein